MEFLLLRLLFNAADRQCRLAFTQKLVWKNLTIIAASCATPERRGSDYIHTTLPAR